MKNKILFFILTCPKYNDNSVVISYWVLALENLQPADPFKTKLIFLLKPPWGIPAQFRWVSIIDETQLVILSTVANHLHHSPPTHYLNAEDTPFPSELCGLLSYLAFMKL